MKKFNLTFLVIFIFSVKIYSQQWQWAKTVSLTTNYSVTNNLCKADNGDFYVSSNLDSLTCIIKFNGQGNEIWRKYINGQIAISEIKTFSTDIYVSGSFMQLVVINNFTLTSNGNSDAFLAKLSNTGNLVWIKQMGGPAEDKGNALSIDKTGKIYLTGVYRDTAAFGNQDLVCECTSKMFVAKFDPAGNITFLKSGSCDLSNSSFSEATRIRVDNKGNIYCMGIYNYFKLDTLTMGGGGGPYKEYFLSKLDSLGNGQWIKQIPGNTILTMKDMDLDSLQNVLVTGYSQWTSASPAITTKFNKTGQITWVKNVNACGYASHVKSEAISTSANYFIIGSSNPGYACQSGTNKFVLIKYDSVGTVAYSDTTHISSLFSPDIIKDSNGDYIICGTMQGSLTLGNYSMSTVPSGYNLFIAKFKDIQIINTGIQYFDPLTGLKIYPNPSSGKFQLTFKQFDNLTFKVVNMNGETIREKIKVENNNYFIDLSNNADGLYYIEMEHNGDLSKIKLLKN